MPDQLDVFKKRKKPAADCGCSDSHDGWSGDVEAFAALLEAAPDNELSPDPRGDEVRTWRGLIAPYLKPTGDGRRFALGSLSARDLPLPVKWQRVDSQGHSTSVVVGRIDGVDFTEEGDDPQVEAWGVIFDPDVAAHPSLARLKEDADEAWYLLEKQTIGPSVDVDDMAYKAIEAEEGSEFAAQGQQEIEVTKGRISAITLVQIPAFSQARPFALSMTKAADYAELTAVTASSVAQGMAALPVAPAEWDPVNWLFASLEFDGAGALYQHDDVALFPVAELIDGQLQLIPGAVADAVSVLAYHDLDVQLGEGTKQALRAELEELTAACGLPSPPWAMPALVASGALPPADLFANPKFSGPTPISVKRVGDFLHYAGHVATWGVCHIGFPGQCITAPRSRTNYSHFHLGSTATEAGRIATGKISLGGGHADLQQGFRAALEHYDSTSTAVADVRAGEDPHGIWVSGVVRATVDDERLAELASAPLSGDWRRIGSGLEMVAALAVNTPGFPVPHMNKTHGEGFALVAAGALPPSGAARLSNPRRLVAAAAFADSGSFDRLDQRSRQLTAARAFL